MTCGKPDEKKRREKPEEIFSMNQCTLFYPNECTLRMKFKLFFCKTNLASRIKANISLNLRTMQCNQRALQLFMCGFIRRRQWSLWQRTKKFANEILHEFIPVNGFLEKNSKSRFQTTNLLIVWKCDCRPRYFANYEWIEMHFVKMGSHYLEKYANLFSYGTIQYTCTAD